MGRIRSGITQATASAEGTISAEGNIGKNKAQGSIDSEGIWDLGIDFKVGGLGITNDYGGAITVSIAGQSITWGREGGKIHYNVGGFEVIVEARDCVVTEQKIIMGIVVASHTYPDPGCELPKEEEPAPPELPPGPNGIELSDGPELVYVVLQGYVYGVEIDKRYNPPIYDTWFSDHVVTVTDIQSGEIPAPSSPSNGALPFKVSETYQWGRDRAAQRSRGTASGTTNETTRLYMPTFNYLIYQAIINPYTANLIYTENEIVKPMPSGFASSVATCVILYGSKTNCKRRLGEISENNPYNVTHSGAGFDLTRLVRYIVVRVIPTGKQKTITPFLQPGVPPHMNDCCEDILDSLEDLKDVLHVDFFKRKKFPIPTYLLAPGCEPGKTTDAENYYHLFQKIFQAIAHNTIVSPQIDIQDADAVKEGDQKINERYLSATGWAEAVTKMLYEIVDDGNIGTNMDIRTGVTVTQLLVAVADLSHKVDCIIDCIGVTTKRTKDEVETSYNLVVEGENTKGFDPKKSNKQLDLNDDISTEKLLSGLLRTRKNPIVKEEIHPKSPTLFEMLQDLKNK
ncbi:hypothetical protein [Microcoleus vaginatus]|uniref:hypothetical protein n=1 Tax=Microcoleus vaginatus TaxID=119532 RepID=UPI0032A26456